MVFFKKSRFPNIFHINNKIGTRNLTPGKQVYGETLFMNDNIEYRIWDPNRSKLAALILNGCSFLPITQNSKILYLGAANGTTVSHISDIVIDGKVFCIEFSSRAFRDLLELAKQRDNIFPILEDAFYPKRYQLMIDKVDVIYQDLSQRDQIKAFSINAEHFLRNNGYGILMIKSRSIDMTRPPAEVFKETTNELKESGFIIHEQIKLEPYTKDHLGLIIENKR